MLRGELHSAPVIRGHSCCFIIGALGDSGGRWYIPYKDRGWNRILGAVRGRHLTRPYLILAIEEAPENEIDYFA